MSFEAADAIEFLGRELDESWDAIVCFEGIEHFKDPGSAATALHRLADRGMRLVISIPNSRTFGEKNEFHLTDFGFDEAMDLFAQLGDAHGALPVPRGGLAHPGRAARPARRRGRPAGPRRARLREPLHRMRERGPCHERGGPVRAHETGGRAATTTGTCSRSSAPTGSSGGRTRGSRAGVLGKADAAAATTLYKVQRELRARTEEAEARTHELEAEVAELRRLIETPRHAAVERTRDSVMRSRTLYALVRRTWRLVNRK